MKVISLFLLGLLCCAVGYGQQKSFGYRISGAGAIFSNACLVHEGFVLDSASYILDPGHPQTYQSYRFAYDQQGKLVSDSNLSYRSDPYTDSHGHTLYRIRPRRSQYFYNEKGAVDAISYAYWIDSLWVSDSTSCKIRYSTDGHVSSRVYSSPMGSFRSELYSYDASGNPILDVVIIPGRDTNFTRRQFDAQNRLTFFRSTIGPDSLIFTQTLYRYDTSGNIHSTNQQSNVGTLTNVADDFFTFDESGRVTKQSESTYFNPADSAWEFYYDSFFSYDSYGKMVKYGDYVWFVYDANGNLDTLVNTHVPSFAAEIVDTYGNVITLPDYSGTTSYFYQALVTGIEKHEGPDKSFVLFQNYPNPFNPSTTIEYTMADVGRQGSAVSEVRLVVYDILGRQVAELINARQLPGRYRVTFDGRKLASGVYFYRLQAGTYQDTKRLIILK